MARSCEARTGPGRFRDPRRPDAHCAGSGRGVPAPEIQAGRSLVPLFGGGEVDWRDTLFTEFTTHGAGFAPHRAVRNDRYKLIHNLLPGHSKPGITIDGREVREALDDPKWENTDIKRVFDLIDETVDYELYDLERDPFEFVNLAGDPDHAEIEADLKARLLSWRKEIFDPLLSERYFERLRTHTADHFAALDKASDEARAKGEDPPHNRIDMTAFQEDWPPPWMR